MTDAEKKGQEQQKGEKTGKWWRFGFVNNWLEKNEKKKKENNDTHRQASSKLDSDKKASKSTINEEKRDIESLIKNRIEMRKANMSRNLTVIKVRILNTKEKMASLKATVKAVAKYDHNKGVLDRIDSAQKDVANKYSEKRRSLVSSRVVKVARKEGSIGNGVKTIVKERAKLIRLGANKFKSDYDHGVKSRRLRLERFGLKTLGVVTAPAKLTAEGVKWTGNQVKRGYDYVTNPQNIITAAEKVGRTVNKTKREIRKVRVLGERDLLHFKMGAKKKWNAGVNFSKSVVRGIKEAPGKTLASLKGCYKTTIEKAKKAYESSTIGRFCNAVNKGYIAGKAAYSSSR